MMNLKELKEIIQLMENANIDELEIEREGVRIRVKKTPGITHMPPVSTNIPTHIYQQSIPLTSIPVQPSGNQELPGTQGLDKKGVTQIVSPMVGTFYRAPSPESAPFVEIGQVIEPGQVICVIEAMKLMNEIKSEIKGKVIEVLVDNAEPVEFGQPMFLIEPL